MKIESKNEPKYDGEYDFMPRGEGLKLFGVVAAGCFALGYLIAKLLGATGQ